MDNCQYYKGVDQIDSETTRILCSYMKEGGKTFKNKDPEGAALIQCCWHKDKPCPLMNAEAEMPVADVEANTCEKEESMEQQTFSTEVAESNSQISTERQERAVKLTRQIISNGNIAASCMVEMGRDLKTVRDERLFSEMGYESFEEYCEKKVGVGKRHGYNFIQVFERFGEEKLAQLQGLGITKLLDMAKLDDEEVSDLMQNNNVAELSTRELSAKIEEYRNKYEQLTLQLEEEKSKNAESASLESQIEELRKQLEAARQANENMKSGAHNAEKHFEEQKAALLKEKKALSEQVRKLESRPAEKAEISEEERNALIQQGRDEMCKEKDKDWSNLVEMAKKTTARNTEKKFNDEISSLKILNDALRKEADSAKDKLEKLKAENTTLQATAQSAPAPASGTRDKINFYLAQIQAAFNAALEVVDGAEESEREALRNALSKALDVMKENIYAE